MVCPHEEGFLKASPVASASPNLRITVTHLETALRSAWAATALGHLRCAMAGFRSPEGLGVESWGCRFANSAQIRMTGQLWPIGWVGLRRHCPHSLVAP